MDDEQLELTAEKIGAILTQLLADGFEPPIILTGVGKNGSLLAVEYTPADEGHLSSEILAERVRDETFTVPVNLLFVDARGEAARVVLDASGSRRFYIELSATTGPAGAVVWVDDLAVEAIAELVGVGAVGEAEDDEVRAVATVGVAARAQGKPAAEFVDRREVAAGNKVRAQCDLVRPLSIDRAFAQLAFAVDHDTPTMLVAARA